MEKNFMETLTFRKQKKHCICAPYLKKSFKKGQDFKTDFI